MKISSKTYESLKRLKNDIQADTDINPKLYQSALRAARNHVSSILKQIDEENKVYYIHGGTDNEGTVLWKTKDSYSTRLDLAELYTQKEALRRCDLYERNTAYGCDYINNFIAARRMVIDGHYIDTDESL